jgi:hypothetical protein
MSKDVNEKISSIMNHTYNYNSKSFQLRKYKEEKGLKFDYEPNQSLLETKNFDHFWENKSN